MPKGKKAKKKQELEIVRKLPKEAKKNQKFGVIVDNPKLKEPRLVTFKRTGKKSGFGKWKILSNVTYKKK